jgi:hypothetical protein
MPSHPGSTSGIAGGSGTFVIQRPSLAELQACLIVVTLVLSMRRSGALVVVHGYLVVVQGVARLVCSSTS